MSVDPRIDLEAHIKDSASSKPLKRARSQAELTAVKQRRTQIILVATNVLISALIALKTFGIIP